MINYLNEDRFDVVQLYNRVKFINIPNHYYHYLDNKQCHYETFRISITVSDDAEDVYTVYIIQIIAKEE